MDTNIQSSTLANALANTYDKLTFMTEFALEMSTNFTSKLWQNKNSSIIKGERDGDVGDVRVLERSLEPLGAFRNTCQTIISVFY